MHIVVVGAGILGASTAFHLALAGARVTIVDQAHDGRATAAGAGIICPWVSGADDPDFYRLYVEAARYYTELVPLLAEYGETDLGYRRVGALVVSSDADELRAFDQLLRHRRTSTPEMGETTVLSAHECQNAVPAAARGSRRSARCERRAGGWPTDGGGIAARRTASWCTTDYSTGESDSRW